MMSIPKIHVLLLGLSSENTTTLNPLSINDVRLI
jgi:hypothetical protein